MDNGQKRWIPTEEIFNSCGFDWNSIVSLDPTHLDSIPTGPDWPSCDVPLPTGPAAYTFCSWENERCSFTGTKDVAYGANGTWAYRTGVTNGIDCNNSVFGDPIPGVFKACFIRDSTPPPSGTDCGNQSSTGAYLFKDEFYNGDCLRLTSDTADLGNVSGGFNDQVDSIKLVGIGYLRVCEHSNDNGICAELTSSQDRMAPFSLENKISSVYFTPRTSGTDCGNQTATGAYLFKDEFYGGDCLRLTSDTSDLGNVSGGFNDQVDSIKLVGIGYLRVCEHSNDNGICAELTSSQDRMAPFSLENKISSVYFTPRATPTNTPTGLPTHTPTFTPTHTPTPAGPTDTPTNTPGPTATQGGPTLTPTHTPTPGLAVHVRLSNIDDFAEVLLNDSLVATADYGEDTGLLDITPALAPGNNSFRFKLTNYTSGYTYRFEMYVGGVPVFYDECGVAGLIGCNSNDSTVGSVYDHKVGLDGLPMAPVATSTATPVFTATVTQIPTTTATPSVTPTPVGPTSTPTATITPGGPTLTPTHTSTPTPVPPPTATPALISEVSPTVRPPPATATPTPVASRDGDANCDGFTNAIDALFVLQLVAGLLTSLSCHDAADTNEDGRISSIDAALILQRVAGLI